MFSKMKIRTSTKDFYREMPNGYEESIRKGMSAVRYLAETFLMAMGTREEQIARLKKEIETADAIVIGAGAGLSTSADLRTAVSVLISISLISLSGSE